MSTAPIKYNNPFALIQTPGKADAWQGLEKQLPSGFLVFKNSLFGARAGIISFINTYLKRGVNTIEKIIPIYAPASDSRNNPNQYINNLVKFTGIPKNQPLTEPGDILKVLKGIVRIEAGSDWLPDAVLLSAYEFAAEQTKFPARFTKDKFSLVWAAGIVAAAIFVLWTLKN